MTDDDLFVSEAAATAAVRWIEGHGIRGALAAYGLTLEGVGAWCESGELACREAAGDEQRFAGRYVGGIAAALILGIELGRRQ